jgi:hypothetical protein
MSATVNHCRVPMRFLRFVWTEVHTTYFRYTIPASNCSKLRA